jgi:hypothetical protein
MRLLYDIMCKTTLWAAAFDNKEIDPNECAWRVTGNAEEPVDFLCQLAHLRAHALQLPVPQHGDCEYCQK